MVRGSTSPLMAGQGRLDGATGFLLMTLMDVLPARMMELNRRHSPSDRMTEAIRESPRCTGPHRSLLDGGRRFLRGSGMGLHNHHGRTARSAFSVVFDGLIRYGAVILDEKRGQRGHYDPAVELAPFLFGMGKRDFPA